MNIFYKTKVLRCYRLPFNCSMLFLSLSTSINFDVIAISETRIVKGKTPVNSLNLMKYSHEFCPTESSAGGTLLYIHSHLSYKPRNDLSIYKPTELESSFIEISNPKRSNKIIGCIYRYPNMDLDEFNDNYLNTLLDKISKENNSVFLLGDFNVDLLKYDKHATGNLTSSISDHLPQFLIVPDIFLNLSPSKSNIYERDWNKFDQENFILGYLAVDWTDIIKSEKKNIDFSFECFLKKFNLILDKYLPLKKLTKQKLKFKTKPWITPGLQKSISVKNKFLTKFIKMKEPTLKNEKPTLKAHTKYKLYRNMLATLLKRSKHTYFSSFFQNHVNDLKNTWKGIKRIISLKDSRSTVPSSIIEDNISLTNPKNIADAFNNYFSNVATGIKSSIKYSRNKFFDFLPQININSFFINLTDKTEIKNIILSLDPLRSIGPNSIPTKILKLLSNDISTQFAELFNLSFSEGVFPSIRKTCKVTPIYKKDSQLNCSNYRPISLLSNIDKILERIMYNCLYKFLETNNLIYTLQFGFRQKHLTSHALIHLTDKIREQLDK